MSDSRRMTTDRFYGGVTDRLQNLQSMLTYVREEHPAREDLAQWVIENTQAGSEDAVSHHLTFLDAIELIELSETRCELSRYGEQWLEDQDPETLYKALKSGVKGFENILEALRDRPMTDEDIMDLLVREFEEAEMSTPGPAARHREWLQVLGYVERKDSVNRLTPAGRELVAETHGISESSSMWTPPGELSTGDSLTQEDIEEAFDTGFGYRISGINPRRDEQDRRYVLVFANEDGPCSDSVTEGRFEYIGEGLSGDQSADSPGNSVLIDACSSDIPVHFFYKRADGEDWEYQGLVDVVDYEFREQDGRDVLVFTMAHHSRNQESSSEKDTASLNEPPGVGETFTAKIDRISASGNGIVETDKSHINIGPVIEEAVGREITAEMQGDIFARCLTENVRIDDYETQFGLLKMPSPQSPSSNPRPTTEERSMTQIGEGSTFCSQCGSIMYPDDDGERVCSSCGYREAEGELSEASETDDGDTEAVKTKIPMEDASAAVTTDDSSQSSSERRETNPSMSTEESDIHTLREKAVKNAVEDVPESASVVQHETPSYNRSQAVKEYVKARADGVCEGCGEPAPFISKTGEPYLHAHHVHELSDGGSDTPDTVVALCPNCHYRVHHGKDGDEYNEELLTVAKEKEKAEW